MTEDTLGAVLDEVAEVFRFVKDDRPQERAHAYLERHEVCRGFNDTAIANCVGCPAYEATNCEAYFALDLIDRINGLMEADHDK